MTNEELRRLVLCRDYCSCGNPDPLNEDHTADCPMTLPLEALEEAEAICVALGVPPVTRPHLE